MRLRLLPPLAPGWVGRVGRMGDLRAAILPDGAAVAVAPTRGALAALAARMGGRLERGAAPAPRELRAHGTPFALAVWKACRGIPRGSTATYGEVAGRLGTGARAVGQALKANPLAGFIPCHRVVAAGGRGGFAWGEERKAAWLEKEKG